MSFRALQRQWYAKLKAFPELLDEGPDGEGQLSDRGNLHPVTESPEEDARLANRISDGSDYTAWAESVLHNTRFSSRQAREVWRLHTEGLSEREIATALTIPKTSVHEFVSGTRKRVGKDGKAKRWRNRKRQRATQFRALVARCDPEVLAKLVAVMLQQQAPSSR